MTCPTCGMPTPDGACYLVPAHIVDKTKEYLSTMAQPYSDIDDLIDAARQAIEQADFVPPSDTR